MQIKMQNAIGKMGEGHGPKAKSDMGTEALPGMDRAQQG